MSEYNSSDQLNLPIETGLPLVLENIQSTEPAVLLPTLATELSKIQHSDLETDPQLDFILEIGAQAVHAQIEHSEPDLSSPIPKLEQAEIKEPPIKIDSVRIPLESKTLKRALNSLGEYHKFNGRQAYLASLGKIDTRPEAVQKVEAEREQLLGFALRDFKLFLGYSSLVRDGVIEESKAEALSEQRFWEFNKLYSDPTLRVRRRKLHSRLDSEISKADAIDLQKQEEKKPTNYDNRPGRDF